MSMLRSAKQKQRQRWVMEFNEEEELAKVKAKKQELVLTDKINNSIAECYDNTLAQNTNKMQSLTNKLFNAEVAFLPSI